MVQTVCHRLLTTLRGLVTLQKLVPSQPALAWIHSKSEMPDICRMPCIIIGTLIWMRAHLFKWLLVESGQF